MQTTCSNCGGAMVPMMISWVCKAECDLRPKSVPPASSRAQYPEGSLLWARQKWERGWRVESAFKSSNVWVHATPICETDEEWRVDLTRAQGQPRLDQGHWPKEGTFEWARDVWCHGWDLQEDCGKRGWSEGYPNVDYGRPWRVIPGTLKGEKRPEPKGWNKP